MIKRLTIFLLVLLAISIGGLAVLALWFPPTADSISLELVKGFVQLGIASVAGAIITVLTDAVQHKRADDSKRRDDDIRIAENLDDFRRSILNRITRAYADAKRSRRLLRARALTEPYHLLDETPADVRLDAYESEIVSLNNVQLDLESLLRELTTCQGAFSKPLTLREGISSMEKYLNGLISEYEKKRVSFSGTPSSLGLNTLEALKSFVVRRKDSGGSDSSEFKKKFLDGRQQAINALLMDLVPKPEIIPNAVPPKSKDSLPDRVRRFWRRRTAPSAVTEAGNAD